MNPLNHTTKGTISRGLRQSLGNTADAILALGENTKGKGFFSGAAQVVKNTGKALGGQVKGDLYREVHHTGKNMYTRADGKHMFKSWSPFLKHREAVGVTERGTYLIRKRKGLTPLSVAAGASGVGMGTSTLAFNHFDKTIPKGQKYREAAADTAIFGLSPIAGMVNSFSRVRN